MSSSSRLFGALEAELRRNLCFSFCVTRNISRPGQQRLRPLDRFEMLVRLRNDSELKLRTVRGMITQTSLATFRSMPFTTESVAVGEQRDVATLEAVLADLPSTLESVLQQVATVSFTARADLSAFTFADLDRPLLYSPIAADATLLPQSARPRHVTDWSSIPSIPLARVDRRR